MHRLLLLTFSVLAFCLILRSSPHASAAPLAGLDWDVRLDSLRVSLTPASDCTSGCWRLTSARYEDPTESGGTHHVYARLLEAGGNAPAGLPWHVVYPDGDIRVLSKAAPEWADVPLYGCYNPEIEAGAYRAYAGDTEAQSDVVAGMGLPQCQHVNFRLVWQWDADGFHHTYLPLLRQGAVQERAGP